MLKNFFKNLIKLEKLSNSTYFKHNYKYIEKINITIWNPSRQTILKDADFEATLYIAKDGMRLYKNFHNDNYEDLMKDVQSFVETEMKI